MYIIYSTFQIFFANVLSYIAGLKSDMLKFRSFVTSTLVLGLNKFKRPAWNTSEIDNVAYFYLHFKYSKGKLTRF